MISAWWLLLIIPVAGIVGLVAAGYVFASMARDCLPLFQLGLMFLEAVSPSPDVQAEAREKEASVE